MGNILPFRIRKPLVPHSVIEQTIDEHFNYCPDDVRQRATKAAAAAIDAGKTFLDAMAEAESIVQWNGCLAPTENDELERLRRCEEISRNAFRLTLFRQRLARVLEHRLQVASGLILDRMHGHSQEEIAQALVRAGRVILGNGSVKTAIRFGLGEELYLQFIQHCMDRTRK